MLERQHFVFIAAAAAIFGALIVVGLFFNPLKSSNSASTPSNDNNDAIKARIGNRVDIKYSSAVTGMLQKLPSRNNLTLEVSSELHNTNLAGLLGEIRFSDEIIKYVQNGKVESVSGRNFKTIEYRFSPDRGNMTNYTYEDVRFVPETNNSQLVASFIPLSTAKVGDHYTVKLILDTGGVVKYAIGEKTIEIVP